MQEMRFTSSMITAIDFALSLAQGKLQNRYNLETPVWCNFRFFGKVWGGSTLRTRRLTDQNNREYGWLVHRTVTFWFRNEPVCEVELEGIKYDKAPDIDAATAERLSTWAVTQVKYAKSFDGHKPTDWICRVFQVTSYSSQAV